MFAAFVRIWSSTEVARIKRTFGDCASRASRASRANGANAFARLARLARLNSPVLRGFWPANPAILPVVVSATAVAMIAGFGDFREWFFSRSQSPTIAEVAGKTTSSCGK